jgi:hypothetical protein
MGSGDTALPFFNSALDGGERLASSPARFTRGEREKGAHYTEGRVSRRAGLDVVEKISCLYGESNTGRPAIVRRYVG